MTEKEKMLAGKLYDPSDKELSELRIKAHKLSKMLPLQAELPSETAALSAQAAW